MIDKKELLADLASDLVEITDTTVDRQYNGRTVYQIRAVKAAAPPEAARPEAPAKEPEGKLATEAKCLEQIACEAFCSGAPGMWESESALDRGRWGATVSAVLEAAADRLSDEAIRDAYRVWSERHTDNPREDALNSLRAAIKSALAYKAPDPARVATDAARTFTADIAREDHQKFIIAVTELVPQDPDLARRIGEMMSGL